MGDQSRLSINIYINQILSVMVSYKLDHQLTLATYLRVDNLVLLDPRLNDSYMTFIHHYKVLTPGHFTFQCRDNNDHAEICKCESIFLIFQNSIGTTHPISTMKNIL